MRLILVCVDFLQHYFLAILFKTYTTLSAFTSFITFLSAQRKSGTGFHAGNGTSGDPGASGDPGDPKCHAVMHSGTCGSVP